MSSTNDRPHDVYRAFSDDGRLLYVGMTCNLEKRFQQHWSKSAWFKEAVRFDVKGFLTKREALDFESASIRGEAPIHNLVKGHWPKGKRRSTLPPTQVEACLRSLRHALRSASKREVARRLGISDMSVARIASGEDTPSERTARLVAERL